MNDLRFAVRTLAKSPGFTAVAILIVALGIGASAGIFSLVNTLILRPVSLPHPESLAVVYETHLERNLPQFSVSIPNYFDWKNRSRSWDSLAAASARSLNVTGLPEPQLARVQAVTANFLPTLGVAPLVGRNFLAEEDQPGGGKVVILSAGFWQNRLGGTPDVLRKTLSLDGQVYTVVGVLAPEAAIPVDYDLLLPLAADVAREDRLDHYVDVFGRLRAGVTLEQADAELKAIAAQIWTELPTVDRGWSTTVVPLEREIVGPEVRTGLFVLLGAVGVLLLITCANLSILLLVRASARAHALAIRTALGATHWQVARQLLTESLLVAAAGGALGLALLSWGIDALRTLPLPRASEISLDWRVVTVACAATLFAGLLAGAAPALKASRTDPQGALKGRAPRSGRSARLRDAMVVAQIALSLMLLVGAALLARSFGRLLNVSPGFNPDNVLTVSLRPTVNAVQFYDGVERDVAALPDVARVGFISRLPLTSGNTQNEVFPLGPSVVPAGKPVNASWRLIHGDYFGAMQIPLQRGRDFRGLTRAEARSSMVISASLARALWGDADPIGREILRVNARFKVIGVVGDVRSQQLGAESIPAFYMSIQRFTYGPQTLVVRTSRDSPALATALRQVVRRIDPTVPVFQVQTMDQVRMASLRQERLLIALVGGFAGTALLLSALGTYGVIAFAVQQRTSEIGLRLALGAQATDVMSLILDQGARLAALGLLLGLAGAFAATRVLSSLLYQTAPTDPLSYAIAILALFLASLLALLIPARRAMRVNPIIALRAE